MKYRFLTVSAALITLLAASLVQSAPASAYPTSTVTLNGHGFGHGRGLGQYGALGYAVDKGWSYQDILDRYYSNTSFGASAGNPTIGVRMTQFDGLDTLLTSQSAFNVGPVAVGANQAALIHRTATNTFKVQTAASCAGPWTDAAVNIAGSVVATPSNPGPALAQVLQLCESVGTRGVQGTVSAIDDSSVQRTVNSLPTEDYLKGVIPRESPASWGDLGAGKGMNALRSQAVAARSYLLAAASYSYATTCNTTACQVYGGIYLNGEYIQDPRSNAAVDDTAGLVRRFSSGSVARTEFSSSTGGYTAGGTFPAVLDEGDAYAGNPNRNWTVALQVSAIEAAYPSIGSLQSIQVTARNGLGDYGGRATSLSIVGSTGTASVTGDEFRVKFGLKSNFFQVQSQPSGGVSGYWQMANDGGVFTFGNAQFYGSMGGRPLNRPVVALSANVDSQGYWLVASDGGIFSYGSSKFYGSMGGKPLNKPIVNMTPTPSGAGYWMVASDGGIFAYGDAQFYGSMGGKPLNKPIVGMASTPTGKGYWLVATDGGIFAYGDAAFYGSTGNLSLRQPIVGMETSPDGGGYVMVAADGGVFAYGNSAFVGSLPGANIQATVAGIAGTATGQGYAIVSTNGTVYTFGDAPNFGNLATVAPNFRGTVLNIAATA